MVVHPFITSRAGYYNALYVGLPLKMTQKLQLVLKAAEEPLMEVRPSDHATLILQELHWLPVCLCAQLQVLIIPLKPFTSKTLDT